VDERPAGFLVDRDVERILAEIEAEESWPCRKPSCGRDWGSPDELEEHLRRWHEPEDEERRRRYQERLERGEVPEVALAPVEEDEEWPEVAEVSEPVEIEAEPSPPPESEEEAPMAEHVCPDCGATFETGAGLGGHRKVHNKAEKGANGALAGRKKRTPAAPRSGGSRKSRTSGKGATTRRGTTTRRRPAAATNDGMIDLELDLLHGILKAVSQLSPEARAWLMVRLERGDTR
jgi:hypothetical protein